MNTTKLSDESSIRFFLKQRLLDLRMERNWLGGWINRNSDLLSRVDCEIEATNIKIRGLDDEAI